MLQKFQTKLRTPQNTENASEISSQIEIVIVLFKKLEFFCSREVSVLFKARHTVQCGNVDAEKSRENKIEAFER